MSRENASPNLIAATRLALEEVAGILESYPRAVIAGGTVPYLLIPQEGSPHEGTVDIDIVLDLEQPGADPVLTLHEILERALYQQDTKKPFRYTKSFAVSEETCTVLIELLAGGTQTTNGLRRIKNEDVYVSIIPGLEVALESPVETNLPGNANQSVWVASIPAFFAMKATALRLREELKRPKDAYDIVYCLRHYPGGVDAIAAAYREVLGSPLVASGLAALGELFNGEEALGPTAYSQLAFDTEQGLLMRREAFERVQELLRPLSD